MASIRIPVICPLCRAESLQSFDVALLASALLQQAPIQLRTLCHSTCWEASSLELEQIREYLREHGLLMLEADELRPHLN
jgi:hypothetical protein